MRHWTVDSDRRKTEDALPSPSIIRSFFADRYVSSLPPRVFLYFSILRGRRGVLLLHRDEGNVGSKSAGQHDGAARRGGRTRKYSLPLPTTRQAHGPKPTVNFIILHACGRSSPCRVASLAQGWIMRATA